MISKYNEQVLRYICALDGKCMQDDKRPVWIDPRRLDSMCDDGLLVRVTLVPPGREGYEHGLSGYLVTPYGIDALEELQDFRQQIADLKADQEEQKLANETQRRKDIRQSFLRDVVVMLLGLALPHALKAAAAVWEFLTGFFR